MKVEYLGPYFIDYTLSEHWSILIYEEDWQYKVRRFYS